MILHIQISCMREPNSIIVLLFTGNISHSHISIKCLFVGKKTQAKAFFLIFFNIPRGEVITPNLCNYKADMTISPTALNQLNLLKYFQ